jgi:hypothetical protein
LRLLLCVAALLASALTLAAPIGASTPDRASAVSLDELYAAYAAGDFDVVSRRITRPEDCPADLAAINRTIQPWHEDWNSARAVFLLDLAIVCVKQDRISLAPILSAAATFVLQRPTRIGRFSPDLSFEVTWHLAALGLLESNGAAPSSRSRVRTPAIWLSPFLEQMAYLGVLRKRFAWVHVPEAMDRFELARGIAFASQCCTWARHARTVDFSPQARNASDAIDKSADWKTAVKEALKSFDRARRVPETRREGSARGALLLLYSDRPGAALAWLEDVDGDPSDAVLSHWIHGVRGRAFDALQRPDAAEREYAEALRLSPRAIAAAEWRAVDLLKLHRAQEAVDQATALSSVSDRVIDPWPEMDRGDGRLVTVWRDELRRMIR